MNFTEMHWLGEPPEWTVENDLLHVTTGERTDFWRETHYGFVRDNGHFLYAEAEGDFSAKVTFSARYEHLYDQAGLMLRADARRWIKFGIEWTDGAAHLSVVVTDGRSDWSAQSVALDGPLTIRATRLGEAALLQWHDGAAWRMARLAPVPAGALGVGPCLASPERSGFAARFLLLTVGPSEVSALHA